MQEFNSLAILIHRIIYSYIPKEKLGLYLPYRTRYDPRIKEYIIHLIHPKFILNNNLSKLSCWNEFEDKNKLLIDISINKGRPKNAAIYRALSKVTADENFNGVKILEGYDGSINYETIIKQHVDKSNGQQEAEYKYAGFLFPVLMSVKIKNFILLASIDYYVSVQNIFLLRYTQQRLEELLDNLSNTMEVEDKYSFCGGLSSKSFYDNLYYYSLRSAITTIMSRNMSHNIGSHVLSYLILGGVEKNASRITYEDNFDCESRQDNIKKFYNVLKGLCDNLTKLEPNEFFISSLKEIKNLLNFPRWGLVEWGEDVRVFMQYLQHRMDFLANISTEWPKWTFPAWLIKDIMHYFLKQRALLDGIGRSEGLKGYYYGYKVCCLDLSEEKPIKIHVVKIKKEAKEIWQGKIKNSWDDRKKDYNNSSKVVLLLESTKNPTVNLKDDICIAIPGGIVGYQAFFVILENVIRNAAKHSFIKKKPKALEIIIEVIDDPDKPDEEWRFRIYDNVSSSVEKCNCRGPVINDKGEREEDCLVTYMNKILRQPIIKKTGEIHRSNWGMAEMKIAATYLQQRDISVLGESGDKITGARDGKGDFVIRAICSPIGTLGYEFKMLKPKDVGIVCKTEGEHIEEKNDTN